MLTKPKYGFHYDLSDELTIVQVPHVWVTRSPKPIPIYRLSPTVLRDYRCDGKGVLRHVDYMQ